MEERNTKKEMIKKDEYLKALNIVEAYHLQLNISINRCKFKSIQDIKIGDFVECTQVYQQNNNCLTRNKKYEVIDVVINEFCDEFRVSRYMIKDDNNKRKSYSNFNNQFKAVPD